MAEDDPRKLRETITPGTTALALLVSHLSVADLQRELYRFPGSHRVTGAGDPCRLTAPSGHRLTAPSG